MEKSLGLSFMIQEQFQVRDIDIRGYSPLTLAYIGDAIYDLIIRSILVQRSNQSTSKLHSSASKFVKASTQASFVMAIQDELTEDELAIFKRGRNAKSHSSAKNASVNDYRKATGFEALMGWLYMQGREERIFYLIKEAMSKTGIQI